MTCKTLDYGTVVVDNVGLRMFQSWNELWNVVYFRFVEDSWTDLLNLLSDGVASGYPGWFSDILGVPSACTHCNRLSQARHGTSTSLRLEA
jgi:hypothetical protein